MAHQPSAQILCQSVSFEKIRKILVVPVCHRGTPAIGYFSKARLLTIDGLPWPMTLSPTNEAARHETSGEKNLIPQGKKIDRLAGLSRSRCKDRFLSKSVRLFESRRLTATARAPNSCMV
jgi:hypothetical protein